MSSTRSRRTLTPQPQRGSRAKFSNDAIEHHSRHPHDYWNFPDSMAQNPKTSFAEELHSFCMNGRAAISRKIILCIPASRQCKRPSLNQHRSTWVRPRLAAARQAAHPSSWRRRVEGNLSAFRSAACDVMICANKKDHSRSLGVSAQDLQAPSLSLRAKRAAGLTQSGHSLDASRPTPTASALLFCLQMAPCRRQLRLDVNACWHTSG